MKHIEKVAIIEGRRYFDESHSPQSELKWVGPKTWPVHIVPELFGLVRNRKKDWELKRIDYIPYSNYIIAVRGDVWFGIYKYLYKGYYGFKQVLGKIRTRTVVFFEDKLHIGYTQEGTYYRWRDLLKRRPKWQ
jgi:hypothetical protein